MKGFLLQIFHFFIFTSFYIAGCAVLMVHQTNQLLHLSYEQGHYMIFVFCAAICSYNFHWYLTPDVESEMLRMKWTQQHKILHLVLFFAGMVGAAWYFLYFSRHWFWMAGAVILTFLYSAPKLPSGLFGKLKEIAIGKTIFLAFVWMYVTAWLPVAISKDHLDYQDLFFCLSRFFLIYAICIPFDYRDREYDRKEGVRSMITFFDEQGINSLFKLTLILFAITTLALLYFRFHPLTVLLLLSPGVIVYFLFPISKRNFSDYLFYFVLDGMMMFSAIFTSLLAFCR